MDSFQMGTLNLLRTFISTNFNKRGEPLSVTQHSLAGLGTGLALPVVA